MGELLQMKALIKFAPGSCSGPAHRGLTERPTDAWTGFMPTGRIVRPVSDAMGKTEGSHLGKTLFVKAVFPVAAGGCGGRVAKEGNVRGRIGDGRNRRDAGCGKDSAGGASGTG